jgi:hypothetical protein
MIMITIAAAAVMVALPTIDAIATQRHHADPRVLALDWIAAQVPLGQTAEVATTPAVFGKPVLGGYPQLRDLGQRPGLVFVAPDVEACPPPSGGPRYVVVASHRDTRKATPGDPWAEQWLFEACPGYEEAATFGPVPGETDLEAYPTWYGRVSALVLRRRD